MTLKEAVKICFGKYADFSGRATRAEFWLFHLFNYLVICAFYLLMVLSMLPSIIKEAMGDYVDYDSFVIFAGVIVIIILVYSLATLIPSLAVTWRRLHDVGMSGVCILFGIIPIVGPFLLLLFECRPSQREDNMYGPNPENFISDESFRLESPGRSSYAYTPERRCPECGGIVAADDVFCTFCGKKL